MEMALGRFGGSQAALGAGAWLALIPIERHASSLTIQCITRTCLEAHNQPMSWPSYPDRLKVAAFALVKDLVRTVVENKKKDELAMAVSCSVVAGRAKRGCVPKLWRLYTTVQ